MLNSPFWRILLLSGCLLLCAQSVLAQPGAYEREQYFEALIQYSFRLEGPYAQEYREANPVEYMRWYIKNGDYLIHIYGRPRNDQMNPVQPFESTRLFLADSNHLYVVDGKGERVFKQEFYEPIDTTIPTAYPTGDSIKVLDYMCYGYRVIKEEVTITHYITPKVKANMAYFPDDSNSRASWQTKGLQGCIPLLTIRDFGPQKMKITVKANSIEKMEIGADQLAIPEHWKIHDGYDYRRFGLPGSKK